MSQLSKHGLHVSRKDRMVVVMGPTGTGKSTFIECATRQDGQTVGRGLRSCTEDIGIVRIAHPTDDYPVVFVDTPGFNGPSLSDVEILAMISNFLGQTYKEEAKLATIIYLHNISDNRMTGSMLRNLEIFASLCGQKAMPNVVIATTMWGKVEKDEGEQREAELKSEFWAKMQADGCKTERFENTYDSAWRIIGSPAEKDGVRVLGDERLLADIYANEAASKHRELEVFSSTLRGIFSRFLRRH